jgi:alpha-tubulin suppressor-like RCC1 family protein
VCAGVVLVSGEQVSCGLRHAVALSISGRVYTWGEASYGQLGHDDTLPRSVPTWVDSLQLRKGVHVCASARATFVITNCNEIIAWGLTSR